MKNFSVLGWGILIASGGLILPFTLAAQSPPAESTSALTEQQRVGKGLFLQNCALCHLPNKRNPKDTKEEGTSIGPRLNELISGPKPLADAVVRTFIEKGVEGKMPGFQYGLESKEITAIMAYLKTLPAGKKGE